MAARKVLSVSMNEKEQARLDYIVSQYKEVWKEYPAVEEMSDSAILKEVLKVVSVKIKMGGFFDIG